MEKYECASDSKNFDWDLDYRDIYTVCHSRQLIPVRDLIPEARISFTFITDRVPYFHGRFAGGISVQA